MKRWLAACLILPLLPAWANEAVPSSAIKPIKAADATKPMTTPMKNAPPTQVDNLKNPKEMKSKADAGETKEMKAPEAAEGKSAHAAAKPTEPPVVQYVPPRYGSYRPIVPSKSPAARKYASTHSAKHKGTENMSSTPGLVRVMPSSSLPAGKVVPGAAMNGSASAVAAMAPSTKPRLTWGETSVVKAAAEPAPEIIIVKDPALRWQLYSYP